MLDEHQTSPFRLSTTLEAHEQDVKAVAAPRDDLLLTASRDSLVASWGRSKPTDREFHLSSIATGHLSYVNSVAFVHPTSEFPNGLIASGSLRAQILLHEAPAKGVWASGVDGEDAGSALGGDPEGSAPAPGQSRDPVKQLVGHAGNICSLAVSTSRSHPTHLQRIALARSVAASLPLSSSISTPASKRRSRTSRPSSAHSTFSLNEASANFGGGAPSSPVAPSRPPLRSSTLDPVSIPDSPSPSNASPSRSPGGAADIDHDPVQLLISTSWDCTGRVWSLSTFEELLVLSGHSEAVWAGLVVDPADCGWNPRNVKPGAGGGGRSFLTGSADKTIVHWDGDGKAVRKFKGDDCVRALALLPGKQFASCSNDGNIHIWSFTGEQQAILTGHTSFVYSLCLLPDGDIASSGEDHSVRIWRNGKQIQMILHPALSVWSVAALPNGDLITGASDNMARVFTRDRSRLADADLLKAYEDAVADRIRSPPASNDMIGSHSAFRLSVDVADDAPPLQLDYDSLKDDPQTAASRFVAEHSLPDLYTEQITSFLLAQVSSSSTSSGVGVPTPGYSPGLEERGLFSMTPTADDLPDPLAAVPSLTSTEEGLASAPDGDEPLLPDSDRNLKGIARLIRSGMIERIVLLVGAGVSTNSGIPDFRSPETGLYANLEKYDLPFPEAVFDMNFFRKRPQPFFELAKEIYPGKFLPTLTHYFFVLLQTHGLLKRCFTQNIDTLERIAGLPPSLIVEAHGSFATARCIECQTEVEPAWIKAKIAESELPKCKTDQCGGLVKPGITFFGEGLPKRFFECISDVGSADLLIVMGTSLKVQPFASLVDRVPHDTPRLLVNKEAVGDFEFEKSSVNGGRDVLYLGDTDAAMLELAKELGWEDELKLLMETEHASLKEQWRLAGSGEQAGGEGAIAGGLGLQSVVDKLKETKI